jgi:hypothetical protein
MAEENKKIVGFKRFSDIKSKSQLEEVDPSSGSTPSTDSDLPANPNLPKNSTKKEKPASTKSIMPESQFETEDEVDFNDEIEISGDKTHENVDFTGKVAKFPKNTKASKAYNFLEAVKVSKKSIWYIMVEKENDLQLVKYNYKEGVDLNKFVNELKSYYISKNEGNKSICEAISKMSVDGNDKYSYIKNIPLLEMDGKKVITKITEDLIKLLSR